MSVEGGFSWFVLFPLAIYGFICYGIFTNIYFAKWIACLFAIIYGLKECLNYRWLS